MDLPDNPKTEPKLCHTRLKQFPKEVSKENLSRSRDQARLELSKDLPHAPRRLKTSPRRRQQAPRPAQDHPKTSQEAPKYCQERFKSRTSAHNLLELRALWPETFYNNTNHTVLSKNNKISIQILNFARIAFLVR